MLPVSLKGLDPENALEAINRACQLVEELGAGEVVGGVVDVYPNPVEDVKIPFEPANTISFLEQMYLKKR